MDKLLYLTHRIPYPPNKGDKIRSYHFLKYLASEYDVYLGTFIDDPSDWQYAGKLDGLCVETHILELKPFQAKIKCLQGFLTGEALSLPYYKSQSMQDWVSQTIKTHGIKKVLVFSSAMMQFVMPLLQDGIEVIVDFVDVDSDKWRQYADKKHGITRWIYQRESKCLLDYEIKVAGQTKASLFVSEAEAALFKRLAPNLSEKIGHINNGIDIDHFSPDLKFSSPYSEGQQALVFTGAMDYWPNVDAVVWFAHDVFPQILINHPAIKFYIVGSKPSKEVEDLARNNQNIVVTGFVDDVRPYVAHATIAVAPLRIARGIQNKVLEAMAMAKQVVATYAAMEGIPFNDSLAVVVVDDAAIMAQQIDRLLGSGPISTVLSANRAYVKANYNWEHNVNGLIRLIQEE
ncbi:MAG: TIGR03087 family PEP-CTERM/XrtA system glycosyltransferase [Methylococcales bacterium]|nr:TIGR03087 family PEP-CTERM/XrtA system glycosyltransferase [Methylococcales bacterium]